ncbi:MAG TPA: adenylate/guanylate cyclase domain-containing protein [Syntrophales bacterium]|nr:adenylate/guanylate cyclase domain-containing protein [Syntrophales bacterium]
MNERLKKMFSISPLKIAIFVIFIALILFFIDVRFLRFMELKALDLRMFSRGKVTPGGETVIASIDEKSLSELGRWPWPRTTLAELVDKLKGYGAKAVGFDIVFSEPDQNSSLKTIIDLSNELKKIGIHDKRIQGLLNRKQTTANTDVALAEAINRAKNVTLGYFFYRYKNEAAHLSEGQLEASAENIANSRYQMIKGETASDDSVFVRAYSAVTNLKPISDAAENSGYFNVFPDSDGTLRWSPMVIKFQDDYYLPLSLSLLLQYLDWPMLTLKTAGYGVEGIKIGDIDIPTDESGRMLINYLGPVQTFPHYSISDIIHGRLSPDNFKNKIVVVGAAAIGIYDLRVTPFSAVYPGVEIHANVIDNILHRNFLRQSVFTSLIDVCTIILFGLIVGIVIPRVNAVQGVVLSLLIVTAFIVINAFIFSHFNVWLNVIYPVLTMITIYLGITIYRYITEEREKKKIRSAFQYYLTASVINEMLKDPSKLKLGGDKKDLTVLFSDIRGFTTISEKMTPEELVHLLNEYLTAMTNVVFKYDGLLDKYIGDAVMAVFGAPLDQPDHSLRACRTALGMMDELKRLQKKWAEEGKPVLDIGIGINSGDMVVGNMGSDMRFDYTVVGDMVNLGARLEGLNKEYVTNIIISEYTYTDVKDVLFCRELDAVIVKGKRLPVKIYELLGERKDAEKWEKAVNLFEEGLSKYKQGLWDEAIKSFRKCIEVRLDDAPAKLYIKRCEELKKNPPGGTWDGIFTMTRK